MTLTPDDRSQIRDLVDGYAVLIDARDFTGVAELFTPDAVLAVPEPPDQLAPARSVHGRVAIQQELARLENFAVTFHGVSAQLARAGREEGHADGWVNGIAHHVRPTSDGPLDLVWHLRYRDSYQRTDSGWLLARRVLTIDIVESRAVKRVNEVRPEPDVEGRQW